MSCLAEIGEKRLIAEIVKPIFNAGDDPAGVGDDCALLALPPGHELLLSTDRVPADLIAFECGILDHRGLGDYLARLNLSDLAAAGGEPLGLLFNAGVPPTMRTDTFAELCAGLRDAAARNGCAVVGGDMSFSAELSLSATAVGAVPHGQALSRRGARAGDVIVTTRPIGLTPAAFATVTRAAPLELRAAEAERLRGQFTAMEPLFACGRLLRELGASATMDNTDGLAQSLRELAAASGAAFVVERARVRLDELVMRVAAAIGVDPLEFAFGPGADFSLVATVPAAAAAALPCDVVPIGRVQGGAGLWLDEGGWCSELNAPGWDHFAPRAVPVSVRGPRDSGPPVLATSTNSHPGAETS